MFTSIDKALAAVILAGAYLINNFTGFHFGVTEEVANAIAAVITPLLVWIVPNKPA